jgi:hypothetical protein
MPGGVETGTQEVRSEAMLWMEMSSSISPVWEWGVEKIPDVDRGSE